MYTPNLTTTKNRCSLCYTLLSKYPTTTTTTTTSHSNIGYSLNSSSNRRYTTRCSISSIERLISSSRKLQKLWHKNANDHVHLRSICFRCCETIGQIDQIQDHIEQLNDEQNILLNKIEHHLSKRALILQGQKQRTYSSHSSPMNHQQTPIDNDDDDTEEGEEKPRTVIKTNGHGHSSSSIVSTTTLVGAKRRKSKVAHKINLENRSGLLNHASQSSPLISQSMMKYSPNLLFDSHSSKHHRSNPFSSGINGHNHDLTNLSFGSAYKSLALPTSTNVSAATPPFIDPTTGALIAIVSNPHHAALLAQQHQQMFKPLSTNTIDEHEHLPTKTQQQTQSHHPKKFPCLLCGRDFSNKSNLNRHHSIVHVAIRNFECARCPKKFKLRQGLKTHMQRCHGVNTDEPTFVLQKHHHSSFAQSK